MSHKSLFQISFLTIIGLSLVFTSYKSYSQNSGSTNIESGQWKFEGHIGTRIDSIAQNRILDKDRWDLIYPETEDVFRSRDDDRDYPDRGRWAGEFWGKYILSTIDAYDYYEEEELKERIRTAVDGLLTTQDENGYIGTYSHSGFLEGDNWNIWSRKYTLWGLIAAWDVLDDARILKAAEKFLNHLMTEVGPGETNMVLTGNFYGMPSSSILLPVLKMYKATGNEKYLEYANYIVEQWSTHPDGVPDIFNKGLTNIPVHKWFDAPDPYKWAKGYEFISCVEGMVELYKITRKEEYLEAVMNIYDMMVEYERSPIGSVGLNDKLVGSTKYINIISEVCDAVYWNRLSLALFKLTGAEKYISEFERTLYNSLLCGYNRGGDWGLRRLRMSHMHVPATNHFLNHHQCCMDNLPRGLFQASEVVLSRRGNDVLLSLFAEGEGKVKMGSGTELELGIKSDFLQTGKVLAELSIDEPSLFNLWIRDPSWSNETVISVNGERLHPGQRDNWLIVERVWKKGDKLEISFDLELVWEEYNASTAEQSEVAKYNKIWERLKYVDGSNEYRNKMYSNISWPELDDVLPLRDAVVFFYGPLALSRDIRITRGDIFTTELSNRLLSDEIGIQSISSPDGIWKSYQLDFGKGYKVNFCDFSSAGNTWDEKSAFNTWYLLESE